MRASRVATLAVIRTSQANQLQQLICQSLSKLNLESCQGVIHVTSLEVWYTKATHAVDTCSIFCVALTSH
ncbi:hypothetical protein Cni_G08046 [Canna indica]|uniref:Uncharacterized protein n=1 Tax=Canna indica TaxID=4628 RepID=A0AAQ3JZM0_9LILI|nr:hypothetical protein Cni_G08046 [Canna indica]